jgi:DNA-binding response OmpR family regulator
MTAQEQSTLRAIVVKTSPRHDSPVESSASRLLSQLGHDVIDFVSPDNALQAIREGHCDLVVIDAQLWDEARAVVDQIADLDATVHPRAVAVLTDRGREEGAPAQLTRKPLASRVRILLRPLHMHGLLNIVKKLERQEAVEL